MKTLLLLRHAKSSWDTTGLSDHDRPLNKRGKRAAERMGILLDREDLVPEHILCSSAKRARATAKRVMRASGFDGAVDYTRDLYLATPEGYLDALELVRDDTERAMLVGHNPGMEQLVYALSGQQERFPTAALAHVELPIDTWADALHARGTLAGFWRPRELD